MTLTTKPEEHVAPQPQQVPASKTISWRTQRHLLEERDRETARLLADSRRQDAEIAKLEAEVGIKGEIKDAEAVGGST